MEKALSLFTFLLVATGTWHIFVIIRGNRQENKAYVGITGFKIYFQTAKNSSLKPIELKAGSIIPDYVCITVENGGKTPASNLKAHINWHCVPFGEDLPEKFTFQDYDTHKRGNLRPMVSTTILLPGKSTLFSSPIDHNFIMKAINKEVSFYIYGHIDYLDVFKYKRTSNFCALYVQNDSNETMSPLDSFCIYRKNNEFS